MNLEKILKKVIRVLFGDSDAYYDKFRTCARSRAHGYQVLGSEFFMKEHTKPIFESKSILCVQNLYFYHCFMETFKILKLHCNQLHYLSSTNSLEEAILHTYNFFHPILQLALFTDRPSFGMPSDVKSTFLTCLLVSRRSKTRLKILCLLINTNMIRLNGIHPMTLSCHKPI